MDEINGVLCEGKYKKTKHL